jgi:hypothetical protein
VAFFWREMFMRGGAGFFHFPNGGPRGGSQQRGYAQYESEPEVCPECDRNTAAAQCTNAMCGECCKSSGHYACPRHSVK